MPAVAGVLGIVAGVVTALVVPDSEATDPSTATADPLHLGIAMVDLECTGESVLVVSRGDSIAPLTAAIANSSDLPLRYLRVDDSCPTIWAPAEEDVPEYAVYAGPYEGMSEPCELRMSADNKGDAVTRLTPGNDMFVQCLCVLPAADFPDMRPGMDVTPGNAIWVRAMQRMLIDLDWQRKLDGEPPPYLRPGQVTGVYDDRTEARIRAYQPERDIAETEYGSVRSATWRALTGDACGLYDY